MFPFKICSAVEFVRIKLWSHQKTEGRDQYFNRWVYYRPTTKTFFSPLIWVGKFCVHFWGFLFLLLPPQSVTCFFLRVKLSRLRVSADSVTQHTHFQVHEVKDPVGLSGWGVSENILFFIISFKAVDRKNTSTCTKMSFCAFFTLSDATQEAVRKVRRIRELCFRVLFKTTSPGADCGGLASLVVPHLRGALWCFGWLPVLGLQSGGTLSDTAAQPVRRQQAAGVSAAICCKNMEVENHLLVFFLLIYVPRRLCLWQQVRGNLVRLRSCVEELRSISGEGCIRGATRAGELLQQAVLDGLLQFKQYMSLRSTSGHNTPLEVRMENKTISISNANF